MIQIMKRFFSLLVVISLILSVMTPVSADYTDADDKHISLITGLGIMSGYEDGTFLPEQTMKRGEFAQLIANICHKSIDDGSAWREKYMKDPEAEEEELVTEFDAELIPVFSDVETNHWAYDAVNIVYAFGLMNGVEKGVFDPESTVTVDQVCKVIIDMLGYKPRVLLDGQYPRAYRIWATKLGLTDGVTSTDAISRSDVARIVYNALDIELLQPVVIGAATEYKTFEGATFLTKLLGYSYTEGRMTDNGISTFQGTSSLEGKAVIVAGVQIMLSSGLEYISDFIGRDVRIYQTNDKKMDYQTAVYGMLTGKDEEISFAGKDFAGRSLSAVSYYDASGSQRSIPLRNGAKLIYNGTGMESYGDDRFKVSQGTIKVIEPKGGGNADLIIVDAFSSFYIDGVDAAEQAVYSKVTVFGNTDADVQNGDVRGKIDLGDPEKVIMIYNEKGESVDFSYLKEGMVLSVADSAGCTRIYISGTKKTGVVITSINNTGEKVILNSAEEVFVLSADYVKLKGIGDIRAGQGYDLYIDAFGEVVNLIEAATTDKTVVLMLTCGLIDELSGDARMKYLNPANEIVVSYFASKVKVMDENGNVSSYRDMSKLITLLNNYKRIYKTNDDASQEYSTGGVVRIGLNEEKEINYLEFPGLQQLWNNKNDRLVKIRLTDTDTLETPPVSAKFKSNQGFAAKVATNGSTKVFQYNPEMLGDDKSYRVTGHGAFEDDDNIPILAYTTKANSATAEYILFGQSFTSSMGPYNISFALVRSIGEALDDDGMVTNVINAYVGGTPTELLCEDSVLNKVTDVWENDPETATRFYTLEMGDIIRYSKNPDGTLSQIQILFDENAVNPASGGQGNLAGSNGYNNVSESNYKNRRSNPYSIHDGNVFNNPTVFHNGRFRNMLAYPLKAGNGSITFTTLDLTKKDYQNDYVAGEYITETYPWGSTVTVYVIGKNDIEKITSTVKSYELAGNDCDRIFLSFRDGRSKGSFILRGKTE